MTYVSATTSNAENIIRLAVERGFSPRPEWNDLRVDMFEVSRSGMKAVTWFTESGSRLRIPLYQLIFDHSFAESLWGEEDDIESTYDNGKYKEQKHWSPFGMVQVGSYEDAYVTISTVAWKYHLQQMVLAEDPIEYLGAHL